VDARETINVDAPGVEEVAVAAWPLLFRAKAATRIEASDHYRWWVLCTALSGLFAVGLTVTILGVSLERIALHFHDTRGTALANVLMALQHGVATFDASAGGLGGCPYAPGAAGNLATDDLIYMLNGMGADTGVLLPAVSEASAFIESRLDHQLPSRYYQGAASQLRSEK